MLFSALGIGAVCLLPADDAGPPLLTTSVSTVPTVAEPTPLRAGAQVVLDTAAPAPMPLSMPLSMPLPRSRPVSLSVPALRVTSEVMELGLAADGSMEVPPGASPVGWYDRSPTPGELGPAVLAGHVDWDGERGAFAGLRLLRPGDGVTVDRADGSTARFLVERVAEFPKDAFPTEAVYGDIDHAGLRLITCGGDFDEDTGSYEDNVVVFARLA